MIPSILNHVRGKWSARHQWLQRGLAPVAATTLIAAAVVAQPQKEEETAEPTRVRIIAPPASTSIGRPSWGELRSAVKLRESPVLRYVGKYVADDNFYGTVELVRAIERAATRVATSFPGSVLPVGELSSSEGGSIPGHRSHESGRDADLGFYIRDAQGNDVSELQSFVEMDGDGEPRVSNERLRFDDDRNWELLAALLSNPEAPVQWVFLHQALQARLLATGWRRGAPAALIERARRVLRRPSNASPHRGHFHLRVYCAPDDRPHCVDAAPYHAWYPGVPPYRVLDPFIISEHEARFREWVHPVLNRATRPEHH